MTEPRRKPARYVDWLAIILAFVLVGVDQLTKHIAATQLNPIHSLPVIPNGLELTLSTNTGAAFGFLANSPWVFNILTTVVVILGLILLATHRFRKKFLIFAVALIIAGGMGNMVDRLLRGYVIDYIHPLWPINFAIFNFADMCVVIGAILLMLYLLWNIVQDSRRGGSYTDHGKS